MPTPKAESPLSSPPRSSSARGRISTLADDFAVVGRKMGTAVSTLVNAQLDCRVLQGRERHSGLGLSMCYIGNGDNLSYLAKLYFSDWTQAVLAARVPWWRTARFVRGASRQHDLVVLDLDFPLHGFTRWLVGSAAVLSVPRWLKQTIDLPVATWDDMLPLIRRKTRNEARRLIKKYHFEFDLVAGEAAALEFYQDLYRPGVQERFGNEGIVVEESVFLAECAKGAIARVSRNGETLAAVLVHTTDRQLALKWFGARAASGREAEIKGASDALDLYTLRIAVEAGLEAVDMGHCRPRLNDGVLRYKQKWGAAIQKGRLPKGRFQIVARELSPVVRSAFANNPFVTVERGRLTLRVLLPGTDSGACTLDQQIQQFCTPGLGNLKVFVEGEPRLPGKLDSPMPQQQLQVFDLANASNPLRRFLTA